MTEEKFPGKIEIALSTGIQWAEKFRNAKTDEATKIDAYLIPLESLEKVLKLKESQQIDAVRAYVGINELGKQNLIFVGAKLDASTGIYKDVFGEGTNGIETGSVVYDGTRPCPPNGDPDSPLG
jgi:hypothetical protein